MKGNSLTITLRNIDNKKVCNIMGQTILISKITSNNGCVCFGSLTTVFISRVSVNSRQILAITIIIRTIQRKLYFARLICVLCLNLLGFRNLLISFEISLQHKGIYCDIIWNFGHFSLMICTLPFITFGQGSALNYCCSNTP